LRASIEIELALDKPGLREIMSAITESASSAVSRSGIFSLNGSAHRP